ncbi:hypothetical protein Athai_64490 [Actinocatenispora thailandica]|uniref:Uncharacterized protein n=1 Tax=Actinocatenispora thailandica TaxID=227318 RepID=A0A7R7I0T7_9ACTN|nr:hypothetical protein Athai_64490 [Actinocatenispora thailandica]
MLTMFLLPEMAAPQPAPRRNGPQAPATTRATLGGGREDTAKRACTPRSAYLGLRASYLGLLASRATAGLPAPHPEPYRRGCTVREHNWS